MSLQIRLPCRCKWVQSRDLLRASRTIFGCWPELYWTMHSCWWLYSQVVLSTPCHISQDPHSISWPVTHSGGGRYIFTICAIGLVLNSLINTGQDLLGVIVVGRSTRFATASVDSSPIIRKQFRLKIFHLALIHTLQFVRTLCMRTLLDSVDVVVLQMWMKLQ